MIADNGIVIRNIFHMLAYAYRGLNQRHFEKVGTESFEHLEDLMAAILVEGITRQIKQGLHRDYVFQDQDIRTVRGKINPADSMRHRINCRQLLNCHFDDLMTDTFFNRILKQTMRILIRHPRVKLAHRQELRKILPIFDQVADIDLRCVRWSTLQLGRQTQSYELLLNICRMVYLRQIQTENRGNLKLTQFEDFDFARLYERFLLAYFRVHHPKLQAAAPHIAWDLEPGTPVPQHLPKMKSDIVLRGETQVLIIDAKFYGHTLQSHHQKSTYHSSNLYQIFTYVRNLQAAMPDVPVSGMLLYAKTKEAITPDADFRINGNDYSVRTLDLDCEFTEIRAHLDKIAQKLTNKK